MSPRVWLTLKVTKIFKITKIIPLQIFQWLFQVSGNSFSKITLATCLSALEVCKKFSQSPLIFNNDKRLRIYFGICISALDVNVYWKLAGDKGWMCLLIQFEMEITWTKSCLQDQILRPERRYIFNQFDQLCTLLSLLGWLKLNLNY